MKTLVSAIMCLLQFATYGQHSVTMETGANSDSEVYEAKMIRTSRMNMEYMDFGGEGRVLIHIQGVHNASALKDNPMYAQNFTVWRNILSKAAQHFRVYAPVYRGYGNSDKDGEDIYQVENIARDILAFMDEMKIKSASLIGRTTAPQVMFYLAENHPDRVEAMVVSDNSMYKTIPLENDEIRQFCFYSSFAAMDLGDRAPDIVMPGYDYQPLFYSDDSKRINIPLYWPYSEQMNIVKMNLSLFDFLQPDNSFIRNQKAKAYFDQLYADKELQNRIKQYYEENDPTQKNIDALKRAFGANLTLQNMDDIEGADMMEKFEKADDIMLKFLVSIAGKE